ncbi:MAG TPA: carboxypeptidase regulatory-like domain-containing protein [Bryobacteraceae bacterium]|nr:carboxypeptidase regulatory-like domain-containing protein [Bryobacteraceae bacterium]
MSARLPRNSSLPLLLVLITSSLFAQQNTATILGTVADPSGAVIAEAKITAADERTGFSRSVTSDAGGAYLIPLLPIGNNYRVTVEATGFKTHVQSGITLQLNQNARVDIRLEVGSVSENVTVTAGAPLVDTYSSQGGDVVESKRITELPLNGRNPLQLATLLPGVTVSQNPTALTGGDRSANFVSVNGSRLNETDYQLDGMRFQGSYNNSGLNYPSPDALEEFKLVTNSYSAEYGYYAGSIFTAVTRSGTNSLHGTGWEFLRNDALNARNFFSSSVPILRQNQFGASSGFPILRNKVFGFASYQGLRIRGTSIASSFPLTASERQGLFTSTIRDPLTNAPFPGNAIPANRVNPVSAKLLNDFIPVAPSFNGGQLITTGSNPTNVDQWVGKTDMLLSSKDTLSASYFFDKTTFNTPFASGPYPAYGQEQQDQVLWLLSLNHTHNFSPTMINQLRGGFSGQEENRGCDQKLTPRDLGINIDLEGPPEPPNVSVTGRFGMGASGTCVWVEGGMNWQVADSLTWVKGRHNLKFGVDIYRREFHLNTAYLDPGAFTFDGSATGNAAADFLLGSVTNVTRRTLIDLGMRSWNSSYFVQDDFKVSRRLTLNLGLRYELLGPFAEYRGEERETVGIPQNVNFRYGIQSTVFPAAPPGLLFVGDKAPDFPDGLPNTMVKLDRHLFEPRIGFAFDLFGDGKTSLRGSYGLYSNAHFGDMGAQSFQNQPFDFGQSLFQPAGGFSDPWRGFTNPFPHTLNLTDPSKQAFFLPSEVFGWDPNFVMPRIQSITLGVQREVIRNLAVDAGYDGKLSRHLEDTVNVNQARYIPGVDAAGNPLSTLANTDARRILVPNIYQKINMIQSGGNAAYHSFQLSVKYRSERFTTLLAYTYSKSIDTGQSISVQGVVHQSNLNLNGDRGLSDFDRRQVLRWSWVYALPRFRKQPVFDLIASGWELSGLTSVSSGPPFNVVSGRDNSLTGVGNDRPNVVGNWELPGGRSRGDQIAQYFNTTAFAANLSGQLGNLGRNVLIGPGLSNTDIAVMRNFRISERFRLQFRSEFFNIFNQVNFNPPVATLTSSAFGRLSSAMAPRVVQFALKLNW